MCSDGARDLIMKKKDIFFNLKALLYNSKRYNWYKVIFDILPIMILSISDPNLDCTKNILLKAIKINFGL